jgi:hypothetical protein
LDALEQSKLTARAGAGPSRQTIKAAPIAQFLMDLIVGIAMSASIFRGLQL